MTLLLSATTPAPSAVSATFVSARPPPFALAFLSSVDFVKQRQQSIDDYEGAGRSDLAVKERAEQAVLQAYLPKAMDEAAARVALQALIAESGATSKKDMGLVMKGVMAKYRGQLDGKLAQKLLGELLP